MKRGTILHIDHGTLGTYAIVVAADKEGASVVSDRGLLLMYESVDIALFDVVGVLMVGKSYSYGGPTRRRCHIETPDGTQRPCPHPVVVDSDGSIETSIPAIRLMAFAQWCENATTA